MALNILNRIMGNGTYSLLGNEQIEILAGRGCTLIRVALGIYRSRMVHFCCIPCCSSNSIRETHLSFYRLPLRNKRLLKQWIHCIGGKNLPINGNTHVCSRHFHQASGHMLRCDEVPSVNLPTLSTSLTQCKPRKPPKSRELVDASV